MKFSKGKEFNIKFTEVKIDLYSRLMDGMEKMILSESFSRDDAVNMLVLSRKTAFIASIGVLDILNEFTGKFAAAVQDGKLNEEAKKSMMVLLGKLTVEIRKDVLMEISSEEEEHLLKTMEKEIEAISPKPQKRSGSVMSAEEREALKKILKLLKKNEINWNKIKMGYSVKDKEDRSIAHIYASVANRPSSILTKSLSDDQQKALIKHIKELDSQAKLVKEGKNIPLPDGIEPEVLCGILKDIQ